ncbi:unnamed protein product [Trichogramma brassicae]|uniref:Uncharacterized protein n=1 Tax=Trichogramma brassicae TaxID=86971 RepID=A0A6H5HZT1_9HYME|nr:unnamed protein product [Trichogramma brassicae]
MARSDFEDQPKFDSADRPVLNRATAIHLAGECRLDQILDATPMDPDTRISTWPASTTTTKSSRNSSEPASRRFASYRSERPNLVLSAAELGSQAREL